MRTFRGLLIGTMALAMAACSAFGDVPPDQQGGFRVASYNAGLSQGFVPYTVDRADQTLTAMGDIRADVLCTQEVWSDAQMQELTSVLSSSLPNVVQRAKEPDPAGAAANDCEFGELDPLYLCASHQCAGVATDKLTDCVVNNCAQQVGNISSGCQSCLASNLGQDFDTIRSTCESGGGDFAYGGAFGTAIFTDAQVVDQDSTLLDSSLVRRGVLYARLHSDKLADDVHVFCTQLSPIYTTVKHPGDTTWQDEQATQVQELLDYVNQKAGGASNVVILGDLGTGPAVADSAAMVEQNYATIMAAGFTNPYAGQPDVSCTRCADNPLVEDGTSTLIDHILLQNVAGATTVERLLTDPLQLQVNGQAVDAAYSDHYGLIMTLEP